MRIVVHLPFPPSVNHIWRSKAGGSYLSKQYTAWKKLAGQEWLLQKKNQPRGILGPYSAILILAKPDKRRRDLDNCTKAVKDFAVDHGLIEDDSLCQELIIRWCTKEEAPLGAVLTLSAISSGFTAI